MVESQRQHDDGGAVRYEVAACTPADLAKADLDACIAIVIAGGAVDPGAAETEIPKGRVLADVRMGLEIVGVGAVKRVRRVYARGIARRSDVSFSSGTPELGYVAVVPDHQRRRLSYKILDCLLSEYEGSLFATTNDDHMARTLASADFLQAGKQWQGRRGWLSLWLRA